MTKKYLLILLAALSLTHCAKEAVKDEPIEKQAVKSEQVQIQETEKAIETPVAVSNTIIEETKTISKDTVITIVEKTIETIPEPTAEITPKPASMDSTEVYYMIRPNDYLVKIAINEYGRPTMWRKIWNWNRNMIGDNPNLIYPYRELSLLKPVEYAVQVEYEYYNYTVKKDDTLWSIAKNEYGNNLSWIVILRDNYDAISDNYDTLTENTVLKLRTKLY